MTGPIIITGGDANFYPLLRDLLNSLTDRGVRIPIGILDVGLTEEHRRALDMDGYRVVEARWDIDFPDRAKFPGHFRALTARPFLRRYFPDHDVYLWLDGDTWVQDASVIDLYFEVAGEGKLVVTPHIGRSYISFKKWQRPRFNTLMFREYRKGWGWRIANELGRYPIAVASVFALKADAPHWEPWKKAMRRDLQHQPTVLREPTVSNYVIHNDKAPVGLLPDWCKWICVDAPPKFDEVSGQLVEPEPPYQPIGILHLVGPAKSHKFSLATRQGGTIEAPLWYWRERHVSQALPSAA